MSLIEQAAKRLEQLRKAGVSLPGDQLADSPTTAPTRNPQASVREQLADTADQAQQQRSREA